MICPNCQQTLRIGHASEKWIVCPYCLVAFYRGATQEVLDEYYEKEYRRTHYQTNETAFQVKRAHNVIQWVRKGVKTHLDVGCSTGALMRAVEFERGAVSFGVDKDTVLTQKNPHVYKDIDGLPDGIEFDCVTFIHSLEHFVSPRAELVKIARRMVKGGQLIIEVPNGDALHPLQHYYGGAFNFPHVSMFSPEALVLNLAWAGFSIERLFTHGAGGLENAPQYYYLVALAVKR